MVVSRVSLILALWLAACAVAWPGVAPIPESEQAALALKIIDAYHDPRPANPPKRLRIFYYTPVDRVPAPDYARRLGAIMEDIREFYRDGMDRLGFGPKSFAVERDGQGRLAFHFVKGKEPESAFPLWKGMRGTGAPAGGDKALAECKAALQAAEIDKDQETLLIFCNLAAWDEKAKTFRHHSPYYGQWDESSGLCFAADSVILDLDRISKDGPMMNDREHGDMSLGQFESLFIGGIAHELGHAFALPHCGERGDEKALGTSIMGAGNYTYRNERRGDKGSFLTMASAMRLACHPLFNDSAKGWGQKTALQQCNLILSTNLMQTNLARGHGAIRLEGTVAGSPPVYGVVAYFDSARDGGYSAPTATSVPDAQGRFAIEIEDLAPCEKGELRVEFCHVNGAASERTHEFSVTPAGAVDVSK